VQQLPKAIQPKTSPSKTQYKKLHLTSSLSALHQHQTPNKQQTQLSTHQPQTPSLSPKRTPITPCFQPPNPHRPPTPFSTHTSPHPKYQHTYPQHPTSNTHNPWKTWWMLCCMAFRISNRNPTKTPEKCGRHTTGTAKPKTSTVHNLTNIHSSSSLV
jgi:hypothetical protein